MGLSGPSTPAQLVTSPNSPNGVIGGASRSGRVYRELIIFEDRRQGEVVAQRCDKLRRRQVLVKDDVAHIVIGQLRQLRAHIVGRGSSSDCCHAPNNGISLKSRNASGGTRATRP